MTPITPLMPLSPLGFNLSVAASQALANIIYTMNTYNTDASTKQRTLDNTGTGDNAPTNASNHVYLNGTDQSVVVPLSYTLGSNIQVVASSVNNGDEVTTYTKNTDTSYDLAVTTAGTNSGRPKQVNTASLVDGTMYLQEIDITLISGIPKITYIGIGSNKYIYKTLVDGINNIVFTATDNEASYVIYWDGTNLFNISVSSDTLKAVTLTTLALVYFDQATKEFLSVTSFDDIVYTMEDSFQSLAPLAVIPTEADLEYLTANPDALIQIAKGDTSHTDLSFDVDDMQACYHRGDTALYNIMDETTLSVVNETAAVWETYENVDYGATNAVFEQDSNGMVTGLQTAGTFAYRDDGRSIDIQMTTPYNYVVDTKDIDKIEGSLISSTITFTDETTLVVP